MADSQKPKYLISACLVGCDCRYDGKNQLREEMVALHEKGEAIAVCPEELAGLGIPRTPCEKVGEKILSLHGEDKTSAFRDGAERALSAASHFQIECAFLKSKSPMCGFGSIYDGTFTGKLTTGNGVFADLLIEKGIPIKSIE